ncbi:hypothetical protein, partial [Corynebacterium sp. HMSC28B08]|uniref:hypothetical protein n=1 Tax=Corynebacterium sp. HMSC28B08 TaxID=1581066 RepID=UPI001AEF6733
MSSHSAQQAPHPPPTRIPSLRKAEREAQAPIRPQKAERDVPPIYEKQTEMSPPIYEKQTEMHKNTSIHVIS